MKFCFVINSLVAGGAERALTILANHWSEEGNEVTILTFDDGQTPAHYALNSDITLIPLSLSTSEKTLVAKLTSIPGALLTLRQTILRTKADATISFMDQANILALIATSLSSVRPFVCEQVHPELSSITEKRYPFWMRAGLSLARSMSYRRASQIVVLSPKSKECFSDTLQSNISVIPNPVLTPPKEVADFSLEPQTILALGRLVEQKNFALLIEAFANTMEDYPDWTLQIFGEGALREKLQALVAKRSAEHRIKLPGKTCSPYALLEQASLFVLPSLYEGFPLALCEAMASGVCSVAADCPTGPADLIQHGKNGFLFRVNDREKLEALLRELMGDSERRKHIGNNGKTILNTFGVEKIAHRWEALINSASRKAL
jgi:glycosyltransferase involved in cell wall biosynthesis